MMVEIHKMQPKIDMHNGVGDLQQFKFSNHIYIQNKKSQEAIKSQITSYYHSETTRNKFLLTNCEKIN